MVDLQHSWQSLMLQGKVVSTCLNIRRGGRCTLAGLAGVHVEDTWALGVIDRPDSQSEGTLVKGVCSVIRTGKRRPARVPPCVWILQVNKSLSNADAPTKISGAVEVTQEHPHSPTTIHKSRVRKQAAAATSQTTPMYHVPVHVVIKQVEGVHCKRSSHT
jgi:hypothetical protein